jgi:hypothetical protein
MATALPHLAVFPLAQQLQNHYLVLDLRKLTRTLPSAASVAAPAAIASPTPSHGSTASGKEGAGGPPLLLSALTPHTAAWERGHNAHIFVDGRLVFHFIASVHANGVEPTGGRVFEDMPLPLLQDLGAEYEEEEEEEAPVAQPSASPAPVAPPPASKKAAVGGGGAAKRKRPVEDAEPPSGDA